MLLNFTSGSLPFSFPCISAQASTHAHYQSNSSAFSETSNPSFSSCSTSSFHSSVFVVFAVVFFGQGIGDLYQLWSIRGKILHIINLNITNKTFASNVVLFDKPGACLGHWHLGLAFLVAFLLDF